MINPNENVPDELVDAVKREMKQNPATSNAEVDDGQSPGFLLCPVRRRR